MVYVCQSYVEQVRIYYKNIDQELADAAAQVSADASCLLTRWQYFSGEMLLWTLTWECDNKSKIQIGQSMHIYLKNISAKFHPDLIWNDRALAFLKRSPQKE